MPKPSILLFFFCVLLLSCSSTNIEKDEGKLPTQAELYSAFRNSSTLLIVYPANDTALERYLINYITPFENGPGETNIILTSDQNLEKKDLLLSPLLCIGKFSEGPVQEFLSQLPIKQKNHSFTFDNKSYKNTEDIFTLSYFPNPLNNNLPISVVSGNQQTEILKYLQASTNRYGFGLMNSWGYQVISNGKKQVLGNFSSDNKWLIDHIRHWEFDYEGELIAENEYFRFIDHNSKLELQQIDSLKSYTARAIEKFYSAFKAYPNAKFNYHIYPSTEIKGLMLNNTSQSHVDHSTGTVHGVYENEFGERYAGSENCLIARSILGKPQIPILESGLAAFMNSKWQDKGAIYHALHFEEAGIAPSLDKLLDTSSVGKISSIILQAKAALFVSFLLEQNTSVGFKDIYNSGKRDLIQYQNTFEKYVGELLKNYHYEKPSFSELPKLLKGFNFAHEGYQIYNGYIGTEAELSLEAMRETGSNTMAIIPYSYTGVLKEPVPYPFITGPGGENDASIIHSKFYANNLGMDVLLKPQIWSWNGWPGDVEMNSEENWDKFFENYENWIMHYAVLAELYSFSAFCVGVEFQKATLSHPESWKALIKKVKNVYNGKVTYAANWGKEFEQAEIWDDLDFISVNCYYPLSKKMDATDEDLVKGFEKNIAILEKTAKRVNKPLLITEIGFKSISHPWINPHADEDGYEYSEEAQVRCYRAMIEATHDKEWIRGIYLWQWPSYLNYPSINPKGFTPAGKAAQEVITEWFMN